MLDLEEGAHDLRHAHCDPEAGGAEEPAAGLLLRLPAPPLVCWAEQLVVRMANSFAEVIKFYVLRGYPGMVETTESPILAEPGR